MYEQSAVDEAAANRHNRLQEATGMETQRRAGRGGALAGPGRAEPLSPGASRGSVPPAFPKERSLPRSCGRAGAAPPDRTKAGGSGRGRGPGPLEAARTHRPDERPQLQQVQQQHQRAVAARVAVDEDQAELHQRAGHEGEDQRQRLPHAVPRVAVPRAQAQRGRRLGHEEDEGDEDGAREFHRSGRPSPARPAAADAH